MKKYELTEESIEFPRKTLYRIKALKDFSDVKVGDLGGYIASEYNLSQENDCWIYNNAKVCDNAFIYDNAQVCHNVKVFDNAKVFGDAQVFYDVRIFDNAQVYGNAKVCGFVKIYGNTRVFDNARVYGNTRVCDIIINRDIEIHNEYELDQYLTKQRLINAINNL